MISRHPVPRPPIAVVVPFRGTRGDAEAMLAGLGRLEMRAGDELMVVDNGGVGALDDLDHGGARVIAATDERSSYYARNVGAEATEAPWLAFIDSDCRPAPELLDRYFQPTPAERCGVVAGGIGAAPGQRSLAARYAATRGHLDESFLFRSAGRPAAATANVLVRRATWSSLGGFHEGVRSGADVEFCWRAQDAGWALELRPEATIDHVHPTTIRALLGKSARYGAGRRWVERRYPGAFPPPRVARELVRSLAGGLGWPVAGQPRRGLFKLIDGAWVAAGAWGHLAGDSRPPRTAAARAGDRQVVISTDAFPARSETFVYNEALALRDLGWSVRVESAARPARVERAVARELPTDYVEDYHPPQALRDLAWICARHPVRATLDLARRRRWIAEEAVLPLRAIASPARRLTRNGLPHTHVHFAAGAALTAMRLHLLLGSTYSVVGHGYDVFQMPRNLVEKLERAAFVVGPCEYTAGHLRELLPEAERDKVHVVVMGVDGEQFRRRTDYPGGATVVAIGRLVEKKGFAYLVEAAGELSRRGALDRLVIAGDGPLRDELLELAGRHNLGERFELVEAWGAGEVRDLLERADVLVMPSVIAADGDRDAMPMVVKEALAMEVPVVTSDAVGLPELVRPEWGRMAPAGDAGVLADAVLELLERGAGDREQMGVAGRTFVLEHCGLRREAEILSSSIPDQL